MKHSQTNLNPNSHKFRAAIVTKHAERTVAVLSFRPVKACARIKMTATRKDSKHWFFGLDVLVLVHLERKEAKNIISNYFQAVT